MWLFVVTFLLVTLSSATGVIRSVTTSSEGFYRIPNLSAGTYIGKVEKAGFSVLQHEVVLAIFDVSQVGFILSVGAAKE
jgi:hypothetical protein